MGIDHKGKIRSFCRKCPKGNCDDYEANDDAFEQKLVLLRLCLNCNHVPGEHNVEENVCSSEDVIPVLLDRDSLVAPIGIKRKSDDSQSDSDDGSIAVVNKSPVTKKKCMQNKSNKGLKRGPTVKNDERLKILMEMDEPDYSPEIVEGLTGTTNGLSDVWEELLAETAEHYKEYGLGNTYEYNVVANAIFNIYPNIAAIKPSSSLAEPSSRHNKPQKSSTSSNKNQSLKKGRPSWWYFSKCLSDLNRKERRKKRNCSIATLTSDGRFDLSGQHNLEKVVPERKRRQGPGEVDFSKISEVMGEITKLYSAQVKDYPTLSRLIKETFSHRSKLIAGGSVAAMLLYKNYKALKDLTLVEAEELYTPEQIRCMHQNVTAFKQAIMLVNPGKTEKDAFEDYFLVMRPKEVFLTIYETKEDYDSFLRPSSKATPRLKALISNESTAITLFIGDFELNESDSLTEGLLNLVLAVHLFRKENPVDLGNAFVALESFALGIDARDFTASQENYYQAMLNTLPSRTEKPVSPEDGNRSASTDEGDNTDEEEY